MLCAWIGKTQYCQDVNSAQPYQCIQWDTNQIPDIFIGIDKPSLQFIDERQKRTLQPTPVFFPVKSQRQRSLVGYSPWVCKESDITEHIQVLERKELSSHGQTWRILKCPLLIEEANLKRLHIVQFQLYDILEKAKLWRQ